MKNNLRRLNLIFKFTNLKPEMFYSISFYQGSINLQGKFSGSLVMELSKLFNNHSIESNGYIQFKRYNIEITLTE